MPFPVLRSQIMRCTGAAGAGAATKQGKMLVAVGDVPITLQASPSL
jgi:hypothetical protein